MTDSDDNQKLQYIKSDLVPVNFSQRWKANGVGGDDDDSHNLFMSEPSISEAEEFSDNRLLSPLGSFTEDEDRREGIDRLPPPPPPPARFLVTPLAPASPGNTSLSSWESPHWNQQQRIHLHFSPGGDSFSHQADSSVQSNPHNQFFRTSPYQSSTNPMLNVPADPYLASGLIPPSTDAKTPDRTYVPRSNSTSPASEGQRRVLEAFLDDLRINSQGQVQQTTGTNISFGSSTFQGLLNASDVAPDRTRLSLQPRMDPSRDNRTSKVNVATLSSRDHNGSNKNERTDESVNMFFSDDSGDETKQTMEEARPLDWEDKMSADDEKTTEKRASRNMRSARPHGSSGGRNGQTTSGRGHFRQRSGDAAAATLSTGSKEWKGMEQDKIPLPPVPGGHDDDDDDDDEQLIKPTNSNNRIKDQKEARTSNGINRKKPRPIDTTNKSEVTQNKDSVPQSGPLYSQSLLGSSEATHFTLGRVEKESVTSHRRPTWIRPRREMYRGRKSAGPKLELDDSSSMASADQPPSGPNGVPRARHASLLASTFSGYMASPDISLHEGNHVGKASRPAQWSPQSFNSTSEHGHPNFDSADWQHFTGSFQDYPTHQMRLPVRSNSLEFGPGFPTPRVGDVNAWGHNSTGSIQSAFSWISDRNRDSVGMQTLSSRSEMSPLIQGGLKACTPNTLQEMNPTTDYVSPSDDVEPQLKTRRRSTLILTPLIEGGRKAFEDSPLGNIGKRFAKADRQRFLPTTGFDNDDQKYPTFVCPVCKTRQREFFTVSSAPRQFESASGYIAIYFGIYVIAALYIFGLEEGWGKLDCIYFAVITLTTAGLGDFVPTSDGAKVVCSIFIYFGVACIGLLLGSYIAGMLDESSRRAAHANRVKSCPNCVRIQNIQEAAERRRNHYRERKHNQDGYDMTPLVADDCDLAGHTSKRRKRQHHRVNLEEQVRVFSSERQSTDVHNQGISPGNKGLSVDFGWDTRSRSFAAPNSSKQSPVSDAVPPTRHPHHAPTQQSQSTFNMIHRLHSRHASLDFGRSNSGNGAQITPPRKYSVDLAIPATIGEQSVSQTPSGENTPLRWNDDDSASETSEDDSDEFSSSSSGTQSASTSEESSLNLEDQYNGVKNARYVFLTLREALVNSLVIIGTGCFGFYFIEGFSFIDSWYFTTVLLTTVGYGDLVPYTKGGKLFATIYILVAGTILLNNMSMISMIPLELRRRRIEKAVLTQFGDSLDDSALRELATGPLIRRLNLATEHVGGLDECTREMFCLAMLVRLGKVTEEDIKLTFAAFKKLDVQDEKVLNSRAIIAGMIQKRRANLEMNKAHSSQTMSNRSNRSMGSYGSLHSTSFNRNSSAPSPTPSNGACDDEGTTGSR